MRGVGLLALLGAAVGWIVAWPAPDASGDEAPLVFMDPEVTWIPETPAEGRLFRLRVTASQHSPIIGVHGEVGSEALHFERIDERVFESIAATPVGTAGSLSANLRVVYSGGGEERFTESIPVRPGEYPMERLTVAPRFSSPLSAASTWM